MKKRIISMLIVACLILCMAGTAFADHFTGSDGWQVVFTEDGRMDTTFGGNDFSDVVTGLQPGDDIEFSVVIINQNRYYTDWWMTNEVIRTLEDTALSASGGAYSYDLIYNDNEGKEYRLFSSETIGGDEISPAGHGLHEATNALKNDFYVDSLKYGEQGKVTMHIALDGETQGNGYQNALADLKVNFAVELGKTLAPPPPPPGSPSDPLDPNSPKIPFTPDTPDNPDTPDTPDNPSTPDSPSPSTPDSPGKLVRTGDSTNLLRHYITMLVSGIMVLILAVLSVRSRKKEAAER